MFGPIRPIWLDPLVARHPAVVWTALNVVVAALYFILGLAVSRFFAAYGLFPAPIWLPASIALGAAMIGGARLAPGLFIGSFLTNYALFNPVIHVVTLISLTNAAGPTLAAAIMARAAPRGAPFDTLRGLFAFVGGGVLLHGAIVATGGTVAIWWGDPSIPGNALESIWLRWWLSDAGGALYFAPALLLWLAYRPNGGADRSEVIEGLGISAITLAVTAMVFGFGGQAVFDSYVPYFLALPLAWLTLRFSLRSAYTLFTLVMIIATAGTINGQGPFIQAGLERPLTTLAAMLVLFSVNMLLVAALVSERRGAAAESRAKSSFLATMSHELRTPLHAILGLAEVMQGGSPTPDKNREYAGAIHESGRHLLDLINGLLDKARIEAGRYQLAERETEIIDLVQASLRLVSAQAATNGVTVETPVETLQLRVSVDPMAMRQVLVNLLSNAVKFTPAGGRVTIATRQDERGGAVIAVIDTGIGIAREHLARVGEPFWQVDKGQTPKFGGSGLGLSITKSLVELHGGSLEFESEVGRGTVATVRLPAARVLA